MKLKAMAIFIAFLFIMPSFGMLEKNRKNDFIGKFRKSVYIKAGDDFYIHFSPSDGIDFKNISFNLTEKEKKAIAKSPSWLHLRLANQFENINEKYGNGDEYADLILNSPFSYVDEIAFSLAYSPFNSIPKACLLYDNAYFIYKNDKYISYADVIDFENGSSTIKYKMLENGVEKEYICPMEIYYNYVVHPRITFEDAEYVYGKFWREYLFYHNDIGYPLLMEKLDGIKYLWDNKSYHPPAYRTWKWSMENHPTAIEALNYWLGKTIPNLAIGDRPSQPNEIYHGHNGLCGELQQLGVAAHRTALIPTVGINNLGEDHVWREFWHNGWHQCDNWWEDRGGSIDNYDEYRYIWNKIVSSFFAWNGDSSIYDVTYKYIKPEDRAKVIVEVEDAFGNKIDGVRIMVFGTWKANEFKNKLWNKYVEKMWQKLPEKIKHRWEEKYEKLKKFYKERVPGLVPWIIPSIWNYTNTDGIASFYLGLGHSYLFSIQKDEVLYFGPYAIGKSNALHYCLTLLPNQTKEIKIKFILPESKEKLKKNIKVSPSDGKYKFKIKFNCKGFQKQRNPWDWKYAYEEVNSKISFFIVDAENFARYKNGMDFDCYEYKHDKNGSIKFYGNNELYFIFKNTAKRTDIFVNFEFEARGEGNYIHIINPSSNFSSSAIVNAGKIEIKGYATTDGEIEINTKKWDVYGNFSILWNASIGRHVIKARCKNFIKEYVVEVVDYSPPKIFIEEPKENAYENVILKGYAYDNVGIKEFFAYIDGKKIELEKEFNISISLLPKDYEIIFEAIDYSGLKSREKVKFAVKGNKSKPLIKNVYYKPSLPTNESNVVVYADVEKSFYEIKEVKIIIDGKERKMYRYADYPFQERHEEDALKNESNNPIYGIEIGQMKKGIHKFRIKAVDTIGNEEISQEYEIIIY